MQQIGRRKPSPRRAGWRRPQIRFGFLHRFALAFGHALRAGPAPWWGLRLLIDDRVPSAGGAERTRDRRRDFTQSIILVVSALLSRCDVYSLRVGHQAGRRRRHDFVGLSRFTISTWTGLSIDTVSRVLSVLRESGLIHGPTRDPQAWNRIAQPFDVDAAGVREWHPAIRRLDLRLFVVLGFGPELHRLRTRPRPSELAREQERLNAGRQIRAAVEGAASASIARLFPNGPPDD
jgi:DNA-binding transcriptional ArsR family regulator